MSQNLILECLKAFLVEAALTAAVVQAD